ncbi:MerR family DNA-binding transcriptional regulator [Clostridium sp. CS001]|uniref:MerR family transcriptional regulator n=1 Tax=Clostridium sp. CS001 TaxID=2880648 RepID=UPI001CF2D623|nr:helix-turn-helix domain-containing protein [Clostridium sp. CS001]MCB2289612.1 MerR family DNA-binding transcriptional regulator [Clostridium sp. CS001]
MNTYKPHEFADMIGISVKTLQRWDNDGKLIAIRNPSNRRYHTHNQYVEYMGKIIQDLINIIHVFSCRIYGLMKYKKKIEEDEEVCSKDLKQKLKSKKNT